MLTIAAPALALLEALLHALRLANAADGRHALQVGGTYGLIHQALTSALTEEFGDEVAIRLYQEAIDNGEDIAYQIDLFNKGIIAI